MSEFDFPNNPNIGDQYVTTDVVYEWDGTLWTIVPGALPGGLAHWEESGTSFVPKVAGQHIGTSDISNRWVGNINLQGLINFKGGGSIQNDGNNLKMYAGGSLYGIQIQSVQSTIDIKGPNVGIQLRDTDVITLEYGGNPQWYMDATGAWISDGKDIGSSGVPIGDLYTNGIIYSRVGSNGVRIGDNSQMRLQLTGTGGPAVYNYSTEAMLISNIEDYQLRFSVNNAQRWKMGASVDEYAFYPNADQATDIGTTSRRIRSIYVGSSTDSSIGIFFGAKVGFLGWNSTNGALHYRVNGNRRHMFFANDVNSFTINDAGGSFLNLEILNQLIVDQVQATTVDAINYNFDGSKLKFNNGAIELEFIDASITDITLRINGVPRYIPLT